MPDFSDRTVYVYKEPRNNLPYYWSYRTYLSDEQQQTNAACIADILYNEWWGGSFNISGVHKGWTLSAIAGALGNWEIESTMNPALIEKKYTDPDTGGGMGLCQWTPNRTYRAWCDTKGLEYHKVDTQCYLMATELSGAGYPMGEAEWLDYYHYTFYEYTQLETTGENAAIIFGVNYLRPAAGEYTERQQKAKKWLNWLNENKPQKHTIPLKLMYYLKRRR